MSEETATPATETPAEQDPAPEAAQQSESKADDPRISKANQEAANYRKQLRAAEQELEKLRKSAMSETERAVADAKQAGRTEAQQAVAGRLARAEFRAAAAGRVEKDTLDGFLEYADLSKFVGDDGEPDGKAIDAVVKRLAGPQRAPDFDGGARTTAGKTTDMNTLIRQKAGMG